MRSWFLLTLFIPVEAVAAGNLVVLGSSVETAGARRCGASGGALPGAAAAHDSDVRCVRGPAGGRSALDLARAGRRRRRGEPEPAGAMDRTDRAPGLRGQDRGDGR